MTLVLIVRIWPTPLAIIRRQAADSVVWQKSTSQRLDLLNAVQSVCYGRSFELALDLGCGPGWSTHLIEVTLNPKRIVGLEASEAYARRIPHPFPGMLAYSGSFDIVHPMKLGRADFKQAIRLFDRSYHL
jgi:hypothetical protein